LTAAKWILLWGAKCKKKFISKNMSNFPLFSYIIHYLQTIFVFWINNHIHILFINNPEIVGCDIK
jgi:hypothetical protein